MPMINTFERDKFHALTTRIQDKQKFDKQTSIETLRTFTVNPYVKNQDQTFITGATVPNSTIRRNSVLKIDSHMQTKSGSHPYLSSSIEPKFDKRDSFNKICEDSSSSSIGMQTPVLQELRAMHQQLVHLSTAPEPTRPSYEPRRPTMEAIKEAIGRAKQEEIDRTKSVGTSDDPVKIIVPLMDAVTCTDEWVKVSKKGKKSKHQGAVTPKASATKTHKKKHKKGVTVKVRKTAAKSKDLKV